jgi:AraC-like DNA-binding protein
MESLFFNTPAQRYQVSSILCTKTASLERVDISNGIFYYHGSLGRQSHQVILKNIDRMVMMVIAKEGKIQLEDHLSEQRYEVAPNHVSLYISSRQDMQLKMQGEVFVLCMADFFLKRYLSFGEYDPVDFFYGLIQEEISLEEISMHPLDAMSLYMIDKIMHTQEESQMRSLHCMHRVIDLILHRFALLDRVDERIDPEDRQLATRAKNHLLMHFQHPPTIETLAHLCATNSSRLKRVFKEVYGTTIYRTIQRLRLEEANLLLREEKISIGEIASRVGYRHQGHFSKLFFATYGVYPKDLLRR